MEYITEKDRIYALNPSGRVIAEVTFPAINGVSVINHTYVDPSLRGQGVADQLIRKAIEKITADNNKIGASCSYAVAWFSRHPEYPVEYH